MPPHVDISINRVHTALIPAQLLCTYAGTLNTSLEQLLFSKIRSSFIADKAHSCTGLMRHIGTVRIRIIGMRSALSDDEEKFDYPTIFCVTVTINVLKSDLTRPVDRHGNTSNLADSNMTTGG